MLESQPLGTNLLRRGCNECLATDKSKGRSNKKKVASSRKKGRELTDTEKEEYRQLQALQDELSKMAPEELMA